MWEGNDVQFPPLLQVVRGSFYVLFGSGEDKVILLLVRPSKRTERYGIDLACRKACLDSY